MAKMQDVIDQLKASVAKNKNAIDSMTEVIKTMSEQIKANADDPEELLALAAALDSQTVNSRRQRWTTLLTSHPINRRASNELRKHHRPRSRPAEQEGGDRQADQRRLLAVEQRQGSVAKRGTTDHADGSAGRRDI